MQRLSPVTFYYTTSEEEGMVGQQHGFQPCVRSASNPSRGSQTLLVALSDPNHRMQQWRLGQRIQHRYNRIPE